MGNNNNPSKAPESSTPQAVRHTPGPWTVHKSFPACVIPLSHEGRSLGGSIDPESEATYAKVIAHERGTEFPAYYRVSPEEARANARLIAAAPDMAQLLLESRDNIGGDWRERRDEILKKAGLL